MKSKQHSIVVRLAWFDEAQWQLLCTLVPDRGELDDTYEQWHRSACNAARMIESGGYKVERVFIDVAALAEWCRERSLPINGAARADYVAQLPKGNRSNGMAPDI